MKKLAFFSKIRIKVKKMMILLRDNFPTFYTVYSQ